MNTRGYTKSREGRRRTEVGVYVRDGGGSGQAVESWFRPVGRGVLLHEQITGSNPEEVRRRVTWLSFCHQRAVFMILYFNSKQKHRHLPFLSSFNHW